MPRFVVIAENRLITTNPSNLFSFLVVAQIDFIISKNLVAVVPRQIHQYDDTLIQPLVCI